MNPMVGFAVKAARRAGDIINRAAENIEQLKIQHKTKNDLVSEVDHAAEAEIINSLQKTYPDHAFLAEESGRIGESDYEWIIDPLDGTTNFLHGFPVYAVSIALAYKKQLQVAVVYDP
ncbi:MAG: inositol monophosphatase, partial [Betaproteobacteria bacterium]|nr:inositol monophosphatase [Betaproteobacteria bacterium]